MKAVVLTEHGGNDKFVLDAHYPDPKPGPGDAVLRVKACTLNYHDVFTRNGMPGIKVPLPLVIGIDLAGEVVETAPDVTEVRPGDRVVVDPIDRVNGGLMGEAFDGGFAEYVRVPAHMLVKIDDGLSFAEAAAIPCAYGTAYRMMIARGKVAAGEKVFVLGASGGVGSCCVQLAKAAGAHVVAAASSAEKLEKLKALGADVGINYAEGDWVRVCQALYGRARVGPRDQGGVDVVVNFTGGDTWTKSMRLLRRDGRLLTCGATAGYDPKEDIRLIWTFELNIVGSNGWSRDDVHALLDLARAGKLRPELHHERFALERAPEAMAALESRAFFGKIVIEP